MLSRWTPEFREYLAALSAGENDAVLEALDLRAQIAGRRERRSHVPVTIAEVTTWVTPDEADHLERELRRLRRSDRDEPVTSNAL